MGDIHRMVVHDVGQVVGRHAVGLVQHLVVQLAQPEGDVAPDHVVHRDFPFGRDLEPHHVMLPGVGEALLHLFGRKGERVVQPFPRGGIVSEYFFLGFGSLAKGVELLRGVESVIRMTAAHQLFGIFAVHGLAFALTVGSVGAAEPVRAFVGHQSAPKQRFDDVVLRPGNIPVLVGVLDAQQEVPAGMLGEKIVVKRCTHPAHVQGAGGTGGETHPYFSIGHFACL